MTDASAHPYPYTCGQYVEILRRVGQAFIESSGRCSSRWSQGLLIHAVAGRAGGSGCLRTNRSGLRAEAAESVLARPAGTVWACPYWTSTGCASRCRSGEWWAVLYQVKKSWQNARASAIEPTTRGSRAGT
jgi:hypothetical protein